MNKIKNKAGVYRITNTENGKRYYGSSKNLRDRWSKHKSDMRLGKHENPGIKEDAVTYGESAFEFQVLCYCKPEERKRLEGKLIDQNLGEKCYNRQDGNGRFDHSEETKQKISEAQKGERSQMWGKPKSEESNRKRSEALKGRILSEAHKASIGAALKGRTSHNKGKKQPLATCPHCNKTGGANAMKRYHFDNCKHRQDQ